MRSQFDTTEFVEYKGKRIPVHWKRNEYRKKSNSKFFPEDDGTFTVEKDYIIFEYNGVEIHDSYLSDKYSLEGRVYDICYMIDEEQFEELTENVDNWKKL